MNLVKRVAVSSFLPWIIAFGGILLATVLALKSIMWIDTYEKERFKTATKQITNLVQKRLESNVQLLCSAAAFMRSSNDVSQQDWREFTLSQGLLEHFEGIQGIGYAPWVDPHNVADFLAQKQREGFDSLRIFPPSLLNEGYVISYIEPFSEQNKKAVGFNMSTEPVRTQAILEAFKRKKPTFSAKIELIQGDTPEEKADFVVYIPLFDQEKWLRGVVFAGMKVKTLFEGVLGARYLKADFELYDGERVHPSRKLYDSNPALDNIRLHYQETIDVYGRQWTFHFKSSEAVEMGEWNRFLPWIGLFLGSLLAILLALWVNSLQKTRQDAYRIVEKMTKQLAQSEAELRSVFQAIQEGILVVNKEGEVTQCNLAAQEIWGATAEEIVGSKNTHPKWAAIYEDGSVFKNEECPASKALKTGETQKNILMGIRHQDGSLVWVMTNAQPILSNDFESVGAVVVTFNDVTAFRNSKQELERYKKLVDANVIISTTNLDGDITQVSEAFCNISGYTKQELIGQNHRIVKHPDMPASLHEAMWDSLTKGLNWQGEMKNRRKDGSSYWVDAVMSPLLNEEGIQKGYIAIRQDITDKKRVEELSITDRLTGLFNRLKLDELFALHLNIARRHKREFSIVLLDIDKFKSVNDNYGHQVGDSVLQELAHILKENTRGEDAVVRWGGEEFLILLPSCNNSEALMLAEKVRSLVECYSFLTVGQKTASFGVSTYHDGDDEKSMVARADEALYRAKENGRNRVEKEEYTCELPMH